MPTNRDNIKELLAIGLRKVLFNKYKQYPEAYKAIYNVNSSKKSKEEDLSISGLGAMVEKGEGQPITYDDPVKGFKSSYVHSTYALGFRVTEEAIDDEQYGIIKKMPATMARSAYQTREIKAAQVFNQGFTFNGPDGMPLFSTSHPIKSGGVYSNTLPIPADLDVTSLEEAINIMERTIDDKGLLLHIQPKKLIVPPEEKWTARELLKSDNKAYTNDNEINPLKDEELKYFVWPWLLDPDAWFLSAETSETELNFFWRKPLSTKSDVDFDTGDLKFKASMRFSVGYSDWRGVFGSAGA